MLLIYPMLAQIGWTFVVLVMTANARFKVVKSGALRTRDVALSTERWPDKVKALGNNLNNQFETPVLFYALCGIAIFIGATNWVAVVLAWAFVASRIVHTVIHAGSNIVFWRFQVFRFGVAMLFGLFLVIIVRLI